MKTKLFLIVVVSIFSFNINAQWKAINTGFPDNIGVFSLAMSETGIFAGTEDGVYLSTNNGDNWTPAGTSLTGMIVTSLAISDTNIFAGNL